MMALLSQRLLFLPEVLNCSKYASVATSTHPCIESNFEAMAVAGEDLKDEIDAGAMDLANAQATAVKDGSPPDPKPKGCHPQLEPLVVFRGGFFHPPISAFMKI